MKKDYNFAQLPNFDHFFSLNTKLGIIQFSNGSTPDLRSGFALDDQARAMVVACLAYKIKKDERFLEFIKHYLDFFQKAKTGNGKFYNFLNVKGKKKVFKLELAGDAFGQVVWTLGFGLNSGLGIKNEQKILDLWQEVSFRFNRFDYCRVKSYLILGLGNYLLKFPHKVVESKMLENLAESLVNQFSETSTTGWQWFEKELTYANALMPWSLFFAYRVTGDKSYLLVAEKGLDFLLKNTMEGGAPSPVGYQGWFPRNGKKARFGQQPIEAGYTVMACLEAYLVTKSENYLKMALLWFDWFYGNNIKKASLIDSKNGGCYDGLGEKKINLNQGAESTICYLLAFLSLKLFLAGSDV